MPGMPNIPPKLLAIGAVSIFIFTVTLINFLAIKKIKDDPACQHHNTAKKNAYNTSIILIVLVLLESIGLMTMVQ